MHFGFALELSGIDLWNIDLLYTHLDLLDTDIHSILFFSIVSSRRLQDMSLRHRQGMSSRSLQRNDFSSSKTSCKMSSRRLRRNKIVTLKKCWRRLQDQQMFAGVAFQPVFGEKSREPKSITFSFQLKSNRKHF